MRRAAEGETLTTLDDVERTLSSIDGVIANEADEVVSLAGVATAPEGTDALNPAFDVTPAEFITAIVTDRRVIRLDRGQTLASTPLGDVRS